MPGQTPLREPELPQPPRLFQRESTAILQAPAPLQTLRSCPRFDESSPSAPHDQSTRTFIPPGGTTAVRENTDGPLPRPPTVVARESTVGGVDASMIPMLRQQLQMTWGLAEMALDGLTDNEALWCPSPDSWTVRQGDDGLWHADWEEPEPWPAPPPSIAWIQWHVIWWWSTVIDRSFGTGDLARQDVSWPGASEAMGAVDQLRHRWLDHLDSLDEADLLDNTLSHWPYSDGRPFGLIAGWVNIELMKNTAEMCQLRRMTPGYLAR